MQLSRGNKGDGQAYIICFTDARHAVLVSTLQHLKRHYVLHFACSVWHETLKKGGKLFGWCSFCLVEEFIAHWKPCNDTRHLDLDHVQEMFAVSNDLITLRKCLGQQASKVRFAPSKSWQKQRPSSDTDSMCTQNRQTLPKQCISRQRQQDAGHQKRQKKLPISLCRKMTMRESCKICAVVQACI